MAGSWFRRGITAIAAAASMIAAPTTSRQVSGSPSTIAPRISATTGDTNENRPARGAPQSRTSRR